MIPPPPSPDKAHSMVTKERKAVPIIYYRLSGKSW